MMLKKKSTSAKRSVKKSKMTHIVDGIIYKSKSLADQHALWKAHPLVESFKLPSASEEKKSKFGAKKVEVNGFIFDSLMEAKFYVYLLESKRDGGIISFKKQVSFELQPKSRDAYLDKVIRPITYIADFVVVANDGSKYAIDVKGIETDVFKMKEKMFRAQHQPDSKDPMRFMCIRWSAKHNAWMDLEDLKKEKRAEKKTQKTKNKQKASA